MTDGLSSMARYDNELVNAERSKAETVLKAWGAGSGRDHCSIGLFSNSATLPPQIRNHPKDSGRVTIRGNARSLQEESVIRTEPSTRKSAFYWQAESGGGSGQPPR